MVLASHNAQKENKDVNNLWAWPTEGVTRQANPPNTFQPEFMKWMCSATTGYIRRTSAERCQYTDHSLAARVLASYQPNVFLDLQPGKYTMSFAVNASARILIEPFVYVGLGKVASSLELSTFNFDAGTNSFSFEVPAGCVVMLHFYGMPKGEWATFTDIRITEGGR